MPCSWGRPHSPVAALMLCWLWPCSLLLHLALSCSWRQACIHLKFRQPHSSNKVRFQAQGEPPRVHMQHWPFAGCCWMYYGLSDALWQQCSCSASPAAPARVRAEADVDVTVGLSALLLALRAPHALPGTLTRPQRPLHGRAACVCTEHRPSTATIGCLPCYTLACPI